MHSNKISNNRTTCLCNEIYTIVFSIQMKQHTFPPHRQRTAAKRRYVGMQQVARRVEARPTSKITALPLRRPSVWMSRRFVVWAPVTHTANKHVYQRACFTVQLCLTRASNVIRNLNQVPLKWQFGHMFDWWKYHVLDVAAESWTNSARVARPVHCWNVDNEHRNGCR